MLIWHRALCSFAIEYYAHSPSSIMLICHRAICSSPIEPYAHSPSSHMLIAHRAICSLPIEPYAPFRRYMMKEDFSWFYEILFPLWTETAGTFQKVILKSRLLGMRCIVFLYRLRPPDVCLLGWDMPLGHFYLHFQFITNGLIKSEKIGDFVPLFLPYLEFIMNWRPFLRFQQIV